MSSGYNLSYGYPYTLDIKRRVIQMEKNNPYWEPTLNPYKKHNYKGGAASTSSGRASVGFNDLSVYNDFYKRVPKGYKSSGEDGKVWYSDNELRKLNSGGFPYRNYSHRDYKNAVDAEHDNFPLSVYDSIKNVVKNDMDYGQLSSPSSKKVTGRGVSKKKEKELIDEIKKIVMATQKKEAVMGGAFDVEAFKKGSTKVGKKVAVPLTKFGVPVITSAVATELGIPPAASSVLGKVLGDIATQKVKKAVGGVGKYKGGCTDCKEGGGVPSGGGSRQRRAVLVKKIMKEKGMSLPEASKYIKSEQIKY